MNLIIDREVKVIYTVGAKTAEKLNKAGIHTVRDIQQRQQDVVRLLGKQGQWITQIAFGFDNRKVVPYRPEDAKSIGRELTFQSDVNDFEFLKDVLFLLSLSVENRARRVGLRGKGITLKLTYADMRGITRSRTVKASDSAAVIYRESARMLEQVEKRPVRLIGVSLNNLTGEEWRQLSFFDLLESGSEHNISELKRGLEHLQNRYHLDFAGHLQQIYHGETLHKTVEYMRKHR